MRNAYKLKNTDFTIYDDIPKELIDLRKKHVPAFHEARRAEKRAAFSKSDKIDFLLMANLSLRAFGILRVHIAWSYLGIILLVS